MHSYTENETAAIGETGRTDASSCRADQAALLDAVLSTTPDHMYLHDLEGRYRYVSPAALAVRGLELGDMLGKTAAELGFLGEHVQEFDAKCRQTIATGLPTHGSTAADGTTGLRHYDYTIVAIRDADGALTGSAATVRDVTDHVRAQDVLREAHGSLESRARERTLQFELVNADLVRTRRALAAVSLSNRLLVRATDEDQLMHDVCDAIVTVGGYRMAWVGTASRDGSFRVVPVAWSGHNDGYLESVRITWDDTPTGRGPGGRAIREARAVVSRDIGTDPTFFWRDGAAARGYRSLVALPLHERGGAPFGLLIVYSAELDAFDDTEVGLLEELAMDLAFGIGSLRDRAHQARTEEDLVASNAQLEQMVYEVAGAMGKIVEARDPYTKGHEIRVARLGEMIAREMGLSNDEIAAVAMASLLHDIGKLRVPAEILTKPGKLSATEFALIKEHSRAGYDILVDVSFPWPVAEIVLQHHERMDGSGYPGGVGADAILPAARILAVSDVVEAMASFRPYRPAVGVQAAIDEITGHPSLYDAEVVAACLRLHGDGLLDYLGEPEGR